MKNIFKIKQQATLEGYEYFDAHIRKLSRNKDGEIDQFANGLVDNDVDAFRHAYVSGVFTQEFNDATANFLGHLQELSGNYGGNSSDVEASRNMDFWNNAIGRRYGKKTTSRNKLAKFIYDALKKGELIINLNDSRIFEGQTHFPVDQNKQVVVLEEDESGRNITFADLLSGEIMSREIFVSQISSGKYPEYMIASIGGIATPMSNPDESIENNLG